MNKLILIISLFLSWICFHSCNKETIAQNNIDPELQTPDNISTIDYLVYNAFLNIQYPGSKQLFFVQKTDSNIYWDSKMLTFNYSSVDSSAITAYKKNNIKTSILDYRSFSNIVVLIPEEKNHDLQWSKFYQKYPDAKGLCTFSRIGFNRDSTQAIIGMSYRSKSFYGSDMTYLLQKENNHWIIKWSGGIHTDQK